MKTRFLIAFLFILLAITYCSRAATVVIKVSQFPNVTSPAGTDLFLLASTTTSTNYNISWNQLRDAIGTNPASITIVTNAYISNLFAQFITNNTLYSTNIYTTNLYTSNLYATNIFATNIYVDNFNGKTTFITNLYIVNATSNFFLFNTNIYNNNNYVSNYFYTNVINNSLVSNAFFTNFYQTTQYQTNLTVTNYFQGNTFISNYFNTNVFTENFVSNYYVTNLFTTTSDINITTNLFNYTIYTNVQFMTVSNAYITNLFVTQFTTNAYLFSTNLYISYNFNTNNTYVSNYFQTNAFLDTYVSNYFNTNIFNFITNVTAITSVTNFYLTDNYISNFFNTNIFVNNSIVSNFFTTNLFQTINISSNYTLNPAWNLTNATLYGVTSFSATSGLVPGRISLISNNQESISLSASNSAITANTMFFKLNSWGGPSNVIDMNLEDQGYASFTACSITGLINRSNSVVQSVMLTLTNQSSTNWLLTIPTTLKIPERTNQVVISNASQGMISIRYHPAFGSNGVYRQF